MVINYKKLKIAVIGLGYVGLPLAVEFGKIYNVIGFDINEKRILDLQSGNDKTLEVNSSDLHSSTFLKFSFNINDIRDCSIFIITVPTPIDNASRPDLSPLLNATSMVGQVMTPGSIIIYESTVFPGCTEEVCVPVLEKTSNLKYNIDFFCGYSPERINPGDKVNTLVNIKKITSGSTKIISKFIDDLYSQIIKAGTWSASSIKVAEASKVIENSQRDLNIAFVNELSIIFDKLGIDTMEVLEAAGTKWNFLPFRPGLVGGHCIGVDPYYLTHKAEEVGYHPQVILGGRRINDSMSSHIAQSIIKRMLQNGIDVARSTVGILGITFKDNCPDIRNSKAIDLVNELKLWGIEVLVSDPWADPTVVLQEIGVELIPIDSIDNVDSLIICVAHNEFMCLDAKWLRGRCKTKYPVLGDIKSIYDKNSLIAEGFTVFRL